MLNENLLDPVGRSAPPGLSRALEDASPGARLVYLGHGYWQLVRPRPKNDDRMTAARQALAVAAARRPQKNEGEWVRRVRRNALAAAGYLLWPRVSWYAHDPDERIVQEFREGLYRLAHEPDLLTQMDHAERARQDAAVKACGDPDMAKEASRAARNPTTFTVPGFRRSA